MKLKGIDGGVRPPDMILFPPGLLSSPDGLAPLPDMPVRAELVRCGAGYAVPVAMSGYAWAVNSARIIEETPLPAAAAPDGSFRCFSAALLSLCDTNAPETKSAAESDLPGVDLGLPAGAFAAPSILTEDDALARFIAGERCALASGYQELTRLTHLAAQGKGPDWTLETASEPFTDQLLMMGVIESNTERQALSLRFAQHLLSEECQSALHTTGAFSVTSAPSGYSSADPLSDLDRALRRPTLTVPPAFENKWRTICKELYQAAGANPNNISGLPDGLFGENTL